MKIVGDSEHFQQPFDHDENYVSRTEFKKESEDAQALGMKLIALSKTQLDKMELDEFLYDAVLKTKTIKQKTEAYRRHLQYIGKLMRGFDHEPIEATLAKVLNKNNNEAARVQIIEKLRDRLLAEGDNAIQELLNDNPQLERQKLRQLVRQANKELQKTPESKANIELFKYLRDSIED
ncbi:ribosome biogenesis factor YjgA [Shewanella intestini]|uniref:Dual-action ribosomal maturation protein DarP n=1 Tax=Shewanella intestini TaxID=2017544 RepID=A0ABS5I401_9GAMM|nr:MULTISPECIES: ribosome biogenesis factor YjgA [Shewanella]MBR9728761.1 ribosome-associated protein [Shewanella intestini]MRG36836.1 ribosome-associated protein [Shewanella sp. XMDDZSB0408]